MRPGAGGMTQGGILIAGGGAQTPAFRSLSAGAATAAGTTLTPAEPAGAAENDILIMFGWINTSTGAITHPTGWTKFFDFAGGPTFFQALAYWIRRGASAPDYQITWTNSQNAEFNVACFSGCKTAGNPYDDLQIVSGGSADPANPNPPAVTTTGANRRIVAIGYTGDQEEDFDPPTGYVTRSTGYVAPVNFGLMMLADKELVSAGVETPSVFNMNPATGNGTQSIGGATIALAPV